MAAGSFGGILKFALFLVILWYAGKSAKVCGFSPIIFEIGVGLLLGPQVAGFLPEVYAECAATKERDLCEQIAFTDAGGDVPADSWTVDDRYMKLGESIPQRVFREYGHEKCGWTGQNFWEGDFASKQECYKSMCLKVYDKQCATEPNILTLLGHFGVSMMIFESGMHFHFPMLGQVGPVASLIAVLGTLGPIGMGVLITILYGSWFPDMKIEGNAPGSSLFLTGLTTGVAMAPTSVGIALSLLVAAKRLDSPFGQTIICAAFLDDILSLIFFSLLFQINEDGVTPKAFFPLIFGVPFLAIAGYAAMSLIPKWMQKVFDNIRSRRDKGNGDDSKNLLADQELLGVATTPTGGPPPGTELTGRDASSAGPTEVEQNNMLNTSLKISLETGNVMPQIAENSVEMSVTEQAEADNVEGSHSSPEPPKLDDDEEDGPSRITRHASNASIIEAQNRSTESLVKMVHLSFMAGLLIIYAWVTDLFGSHLWGCFMAGMSFSSVPGSALIWSSQTKRINAWMMRIFFSCTVGFAIPIKALLDGPNFGLGILLGIFACVGPKLVCAGWDKTDRWLVGWAMTGRAEFAYLIAEMGKQARLIGDDLFAQLIWALLCATITAPTGFSYCLRQRQAGLDDVELDDIAAVASGAPIVHAPSTSDVEVGKTATTPVSGRSGDQGPTRKGSKGMLQRAGTRTFLAEAMPHQASSMSYVVGELKREPSMVLPAAFQLGGAGGGRSK
eukprot:g10057.t1